MGRNQVNQSIGSVNASSLASVVNGASSKSTPVDADRLSLTDSASSYGLKKFTFANLKSALKTYFDTLYSGGGGGAVTPQTATMSLESAGSIDMGDGAWLDLDVDEDGSLSIIDATTISTGIFYKIDMNNSAVTVSTVTIPSGWISNTMGGSIPLDPDEYSSALMWKDNAGSIHISAGFSSEVA